MQQAVQECRALDKSLTAYGTLVPCSPFYYFPPFCMALRALSRTGILALAIAFTFTAYTPVSSAHHAPVFVPVPQPPFAQPLVYPALSKFDRRAIVHGARCYYGLPTQVMCYYNPDYVDYLDMQGYYNGLPQ